MSPADKRSRYDALAHLLMREEGWRGMPYDDETGQPVPAPRGNLTVGYGTMFPLTEEEGAWLLRHRMEREIAVLARELMTVSLDGPHIVFDALPREAWIALGDMAYTLGGGEGVLDFHRMLCAVARGHWREAAAEVRASKWDRREAHNRAERVARRLEGLAKGSKG